MALSQSVSHRHLEGSFALLVGVVHGLVARNEKALPGGLLVLTTPRSGISFGGGIQDGQVGDADGRPDLAQLIAYPSGCPGSLYGISVA